MMTANESRTRRAMAVFVLVDNFVRERGINGPVPPPVGWVRFQLEEVDFDGTVRHLDPPWVLSVVNSRPGVYGFDGTAALPDGSNIRLGTTAFSARIRINSACYQPVQLPAVALPLGGGPIRVELQPGYDYPFPAAAAVEGGLGATLVRGSVHQRDGSVPEGAVVALQGRPDRYPIDSTGQWVFPLPDVDAVVTVIASRPGQSDEVLGDVAITRGREASLRWTSLRGLVRQGGKGIGGASVALPDPLGSVSTRPDGTWAFYLPFSFPAGKDSLPVTANAPDGRLMTHQLQVARFRTNTVPIFEFP